MVSTKRKELATDVRGSVTGESILLQSDYEVSDISTGIGGVLMEIESECSRGP